MPRINIYEQDNTGSSPVADLAVVYVPGTVAIKNKMADTNNCIYIPSTATDLGDYFEDPDYTYSTDAEIDIRHMIKELISLNYGVVYQQITNKEYTLQEPFNAELYYTTNYDFESEGQTFKNETAYNEAVSKLRKDQIFATMRTDTAIGNAYNIAEWDEEAPNTIYYIGTCNKSLYIKSGNEYVEASGEYIGTTPYYTAKIVLPTTENAWDFLLDKNAYDIKFITTGNFKTIPVGKGTSQKTTMYSFDFTLTNALLDVPTTRKDCALLVDLDYNVDDINNANDLAKDFKTALNNDTASAGEENKWILIKSTGGVNPECVSSRAYTLFSNCLMNYENYTLSVPGSFAYLYAYAVTNNIATNWLPISGVTRGVIGEIFTPDIEISKYFLDTQIISDEAGVSFNGVVNVRSYGYTIWGDRTLLQQDAVKRVQATSYFSLRNLISDIAKTAYNSAIRYTYETNNDVTWLNFKQAITALLDQMVSSGVLQTYKVNRKPSSDAERNKMIAVIKIYPILPVENFDVYINLENAELTTTADDIQA